MLALINPAKCISFLCFCELGVISAVPLHPPLLRHQQAKMCFLHHYVRHTNQIDQLETCCAEMLLGMNHDWETAVSSGEMQ